MFHLLSWLSRKEKCPVRYIGAAKILAAGEEIDEIKVLAENPATITGTGINM